MRAELYDCDPRHGREGERPSYELVELSTRTTPTEPRMEPYL